MYREIEVFKAKILPKIENVV